MGLFYQLCQWASRAVDWETGKGATLPLPRLKLGWLRQPRFLALAEFFVSTLFPHCGTWDQAITPRTQTEYRKSKKGKDRQNWRNVNGLYFEKRENNCPAFFNSFSVWSVKHEFFSPVPAINVHPSL